MSFFAELHQKALARALELAMSAIGGFAGWVSVSTFTTEPYFARYIQWGSVIGAAAGLVLYWAPRQLAIAGLMLEHPFSSPRQFWRWLLLSVVMFVASLFLSDVLWARKDLGEFGLMVVSWSFFFAALVSAHVLSVAFAAFADRLLELRKPPSNAP